MADSVAARYRKRGYDVVVERVEDGERALLWLRKEDHAAEVLLIEETTAPR